MKNLLVDTNIFLRYLLEDDHVQVEKVEELFSLAKERELRLETNWLIVAEIAYVLFSVYKFPKKRVCKSLKKALSLSFIMIDKKDLIIQAINIFEKKNVDFIDCLNYVFAKAKKLKIASFDKDFDKIDKRIRYKLK